LRPFQIKWKGRPLEFYKSIPARGGGTKYEQGGRLKASIRLTICSVAYDLGMSEQQFYQSFSKAEREQILATKQAHSDIEWVQRTFPIKSTRGKR
jgi:hypothetical protein